MFDFNFLSSIYQIPDYLGAFDKISNLFVAYTRSPYHALIPSTYTR